MRQTTLRHKAATIRPFLRGIFASVLVLSLFSPASRADENSSSRREAAKAQFDRAEKSRQGLESRAEGSRTLKDYTALVIEYQRVYLITSHAAEVPASLKEVADLFRTMGDLFDSKYYQRAIDSYQFLLQEYPASKFREDAQLAIGHIQQDDLHDYAAAKKTYQQFLAQHARSSHASEVRAALDKTSSEIAAANSNSTQPSAQASKDRTDRTDRATTKNVSAEKTPPASDTRQGSDDDSDTEKSGPQVSRIRTWNADTYTRIVIDVGSKVKYQAARISGPDRIYFDIEGAKLSSALLHKPIDLDGGGFLKTVRVAQNQSGVVRVVLEVNRVTDYSVFLLPNPYRLVVDVYGTAAGVEEAAHNTAPAPGPTTTAELPATPAAKPVKEAVAKESAAPKEAENSPKETDKPAAKSARAASAGASVADARTALDSEISAEAAADLLAATKKPAAPSTKNPPKAGVTSSTKGTSASDKSGDDSTLSAAANPVSTEVLPLPSHPAWPKKSSRGSKSAHDQAAEMGPPPVPELTLDGQHSLTRALGLKIGRIVIDAGHGGHDTGTIGPTGLMEKDLCLDVALRLGKIIQQKLPSAEVVFTRNDDTFIPLERRTEIANEAKADLFVSVHANSSQDRQARGIETYYLNFTGSSDAMEVASRENALSENAVHDLQDIVKKIASNEKIEESRDLASMIQDSMSKRMENFNRGERNRGVRKAPFVVLIGADMPSVLSEISFLSNPSDEQWLKKPDNRQRIADGLYHGIESYLQSTNSLTSNQIHSAAENFAGKVARSGNSQ
ncbi:MAG TPA: N-acetylmuramoyl-L-alanine amidase [Candidatus Acidoferrales bacterium]|nr:N-acetylmuramoyl-L-alanine amidase [Candidatus Acidoferrales bacterium]